MPLPDNYVEAPNFKVLLSPGNEQFFEETVKAYAWLKFLWAGPNPNIAVDFRNVYQGASLSAQTLYQSMMDEVEDLNLPGVVCGPTILHESGPFSPYRAYLSIRREWSEFLICAAPVGSSFLISVRKIDHFPHIKWFHYIPLFLGLFAAFGTGFVLDGLVGGFLVMALIASFIWSLFRYSARAAESWFGKHLQHIPFVAPIYIRWFRPDTFYRQDLHAAFLSLVDTAIKGVVAELDQAQGVRIGTEKQGTPAHPDLQA